MKQETYTFRAFFIQTHWINILGLLTHGHKRYCEYVLNQCYPTYNELPSSRALPVCLFSYLEHTLQQNLAATFVVQHKLTRKYMYNANNSFGL